MPNNNAFTEELDELFSLNNEFMKRLRNDAYSSINYFKNILSVIIFLWQQNANQCYNALKDTKYMDIIENSMCLNTNNLVFYRGINNISKSEFNEDRNILSASSDYIVAQNFALYRNNKIRDDSKLNKGIVLHLLPKKILAVHEIVSVDEEKEYFIMDYQILKIDEVNNINKEVNLCQIK